jgi:hypothetical protein
MNQIGTSLLLLLLVAAEGQPAPKVPVGKETTVATGPLDKEGYIDYEAALNERLGQGVTPGRNANVLLWRAFGPRPEGGEGMPAEFFKQLGIDEPPEKGDYFVGLEQYLKDHLKPAPTDFNPIQEQLGRAYRRPWAAEEYPDLAAWLVANEKPLALVIEATKRPSYFNPRASHRPEKGPGGLINALVPCVVMCRRLAHALTARAMLRVREGKFDEAWQDLLACRRLGRLVARGPSLIEFLVGIAIDQSAGDAQLAYLERARLSGKQVRDRVKDLQALPPLPPFADMIDLGERFTFLDCLQMVRRGGPGVFDAFAGRTALKKPEPKMQRALDQIDWGPAFRSGNRWYDRLAAALRVKDRVKREQQLNQIEEDLKALTKDVTEPANLAKLLMAKGGPAKAVSKEMADVLFSLMMPAARKVQDAADRPEQGQRNLYVAFALAAYRLENGRYPAKLEELAPKYLVSVPGDLFSGKALIYHPSENGYLFYSVGTNGKDDGGRWYDDDPPGDDPRVRMPLPELKRKK